MKIASLASGSAGNAYCVSSGNGTVMIDCGIGCRELVRRCAAAGVDPASVSSVLFTHNHVDHVRGAAAFRNKFPQARFLANYMTAEAISSATGLPQDVFDLFENGQTFEAGGFSVTPFSVPHDVPDAVGFVMRAGDLVYFHATDCGSALDSIGARLAGADAAVLESNHDPAMLARSSRPESLKRRIRGPRGHLSNDDAADLVRRFPPRKLKLLMLAHLSRECNAPHLAEGAMREALRDAGLAGVELRTLGQDEAFCAEI